MIDEYSDFDDELARAKHFLEAAGDFSRGKVRVWIFDGEHHHFREASDPTTEEVVVARYRQLGPALVARLLVAALWPGPLGVVQRWSEWRKHRENELMRHRTAECAAAIISDVIKAAKRKDVAGLARAVTRYYSVFDEARRDAEVAAQVWALIHAEMEEAEPLQPCHAQPGALATIESSYATPEQSDDKSAE